MDATLSLGILLLALAVMLISPAGACSCMQAHPQDHFCSKSFVIKARVKGAKVTEVNDKTGRPVWRNHTISIERVFKASDAFNNASHTHFLSALSGATCGIALKNRHKYLIMGGVVDGTLRVSMCDYYAEWSTVSRNEKRGVRRKYKENCDCKVKVCWARGCEKKRSPATCPWNPRADTGTCFGKHGLCRKRPNGKCRWSSSGEMIKCIANVEEERRKEP